MEFNQIELDTEDMEPFKRHNLVEMYQNIVDASVYHTPVAMMLRLARDVYYLRWDPKDITLLDLVSKLQYYVNPYNYEQLSVATASEMEYLIRLMDKHKEPVTIKVHNFGDANKVQ